MISNILKLAAFSCVTAGCYVANYNQISINNPQLSYLFQKVDDYVHHIVITVSSIYRIFVQNIT